MLQTLGMELGSLSNQRNCQSEEFLLWKEVFYKPLNKHLRPRDVKDRGSHAELG